MEALQRESGHNWEHWDGLGETGGHLGYWGRDTGKHWDRLGAAGADWDGLGILGWIGIYWDGLGWRYWGDQGHWENWDKLGETGMELEF